MHKKIFEISKPGINVIKTPNMTSASVNGYSATSLFSLWNKNAVSQNCNYDSDISFKKPMYVTNIEFGSAQTATWYMPHNCVLYLYRNGSIVYTLNYDSRSYIGANLVLPKPIFADSAYRNVGSNSDWQWNDGEGRPERNYNNGCIIDGITV